MPDKSREGDYCTPQGVFSLGFSFGTEPMKGLDLEYRQINSNCYWVDDVCSPLYKKKPRKYLRHNYNCTSYMKFGKRYCPSHYIKMQDMDAIVLEDIRSLAQLVVEGEEKAKAKFLERKAKHHEEQYSVDTKKLTEGRFRLQELDTLIQNIYEDKVLGKVSEGVAMKLIAKYETEQKELSVEVAELEEKFSTIRQDEEDVALLMERLRKYTDVQELTREMCLELIEYITLDAYVEEQPREIYIYYKLLDEPLKDKRSLF